MRSGGIGRCDLDLPVLMGFFEMICLGGIYGILSEREVHAKILRDGMVFRWDSLTYHLKYICILWMG